MTQNCASMPPTINDRESSKSPSGSHSIDDILGIKASQMATSQQQQAAYSGSESSSDSSSNSASDPETSPAFPLENPASSRHQQLLQVAAAAGEFSPQQQHQRHGEGPSFCSSACMQEKNLTCCVFFKLNSFTSITS